MRLAGLSFVYCEICIEAAKKIPISHLYPPTTLSSVQSERIHDLLWLGEPGVSNLCFVICRHWIFGMILGL
jgi:hypothetical protein